MKASIAAFQVRHERWERQGGQRPTRTFAHIWLHQNAAGVLSHLLTQLSLLRLEPPAPDPLTPDFSPAAIEALRDLCLAQAQEVFWQKAVMGTFPADIAYSSLANPFVSVAGRLKNGTIAKLAAQVADFYGKSAQSMQAAKGPEAWPSFSFPEVRTATGANGVAADLFTPSRSLS